MKFLNKKSPALIGLDIGSDSIKLLQLSSSGSSYRVEHVAMEPLPEGAVVENAVTEQEEVANSIKKALKASGTRAKNCAVAVSGSAVITKIINVPADLTEDEVEAQIEIESGQHIPFPREEVSLDFEVLGPSPRNADVLEVLLAASKSENVEIRRETAEMAGLRTQVVDVEAYAMGNAFELVRKRDGISDSQTTGVLDIGSVKTTMIVMRAGRVVYTRDHPFGGRQLTEEAMRRYGLNASEARFLERGEEPPPGFEDEVLSPFRSSIVQQISRALQFYSSSSEYSSLGTLYLAGGCAALDGLSELVGNELGISCELADPLRGLRLSTGINASKIERQMPALMVACGLALRGFD